MDIYSIIIYMLRWLPGISLYCCVAVKTPDPLFPRLTARSTPTPKNKNVEWQARMHPPQKTTHPKTMAIVST